MENRSFEFTSSDGLKMFAKALEIENPKAIIIIVHGMGEHIARYHHVAEFFNKNGFSVYGFDHRGHGKSEGKRGHTPSYEQLLKDVDVFVNKIKADNPNKNILLYGHSMGGNVCLNYLMKKSNNIKAATISAPWIKLAFEPPAIKVVLGNLMVNIYPSLTQPSGLNPNHISRDKAEVEKYINDKLVHDKISAGFFVNTYKAGYYILENPNDLKTPIFLIHGTGDQLTSHKASEEFAEKSKKVNLKIYKDLYHELHNEPEKEEVLNDVLQFFNQHI
jgi:acylglycerol lipase